MLYDDRSQVKAIVDDAWRQQPLGVWWHRMRQTLRPDQERVVEGVVQHSRSGHRRILVCAPTGMGKTTVWAHLTERTVAKGQTSWMIVHRDELARQAAERARNQGMAVGILMGTPRSTDEAAPVQVIGIDTLTSRLRTGGWLPAPPRSYFVDEAHHASSPSWRAAIDSPVLKDAAGVFLSATPWQANGTGLGVATALVMGPTAEELVALGVLVRPTIYCGPAPDLRGVPSSCGDFVQQALATRTSAVVGDVVATWKRLRSGRTLAFAVNRQHSQQLVNRWRDAGAAAEHVDANTPDSERERIFERLAAGELDVVSNVGIVTEGFDCPAVETCVLAAPTQSDRKYLQSVGRVLRASPGKSGCIVLDHGYNAMRHGHPFTNRTVTLEGRFGQRKVSEKEIVEDGSPHFRSCHQCLMAMDPDERVCPGCGAKVITRGAPSERRAVQLVKFDELPAEQRDHFKVMERRAAWYALDAACKVSGRSPWQASYQYRARYGMMPHDDRIFLTRQERRAYFAARKRA